MNGRKGHLNGKTIVFFGTSPFAVPTLELLHNEGANILLVVTGLAKPSGRGKSITKTPVHLKAEELNLKVYNTQKPEALNIPQNFDFGITISYGAIIPSSILQMAKYGFLNLHPSSLPLFRGAAPIERTLEAGHTQTEICVIKMTPKLDDGPIITSQHYNILEEENSLNLHQKFANIGANLMVEAILKLPTITNFNEQKHENATYAKKITKEELHLKQEGCLSLSSAQVINKIRAFASYGFMFIFYKNLRVKIIKARHSSSKITPLDLTVSNGFVTPIIIKPEGKKEMRVEEFLNGLKL